MGIQQHEDPTAEPTPPTVQPPSPAVTPPAAQVSSDGDPALTFKREKPTRWLSPGLLLHSAAEVVISGLLGQYNDKREIMAALPEDPPLDLRTKFDEVWFDYVSDTGDGFDATYTVAHLLAQPALSVQPEQGPALSLPHGRLLIMGGDQCYPSANIQAYEDRLIGPYRAAMPAVLDSPDKTHLRVVPGNHDWYDGLTAYMRTFCQGRDFGDWLTGQSRSYFAVCLPGRWWLWGVDIQFDTYIDDAQLRYFRKAAEGLERDDAVILCSAKPSWVSAEDEDKEAYATIDFLDRKLIQNKGAHLRVCLTGDRHHYVRYEAADGAQKVTAGGGGAYLSPTHHLPPTVSVPPERSEARGKSTPPKQHQRRASFPEPSKSRSLGLGVLKLPWTTPTFTLLMGGIQTLLCLAMIWALSPETLSLREQMDSTASSVGDAGPSRLAASYLDSFSGAVLAVLVILGAIGFTGKVRSIRGPVVGAVHGALHLALAVFVTWLAASLTTGLSSGWMLLSMLPIVFVVGGLLAAALVALYLVLADLVRLNTNELYAAQAIPDFKNFLRLHVDSEGYLVIYPLGVPSVARAWRNQQPGTAGSAIQPAGGSIEYQLIEEPIRVDPSPSSLPTPD